MRKLMLIACVLLALTVMVGCGRKKASNLDYIPAGMSAVGTLDVAKARTIKMIEEKVEETKGEEDPDFKALEAAGLTVDKITKITFGMDLASEPVSGAVVVELNSPVSDQAKVIEILKKKKADAVFLSPTLLAGGPEGMGAKIKAVKDGKAEGIKTNSELMDVAGKGDQSGLLWLAAIIPAEKVKKAIGDKAAMSPVKPDQVKDVFVTSDYTDAAGLSLKAVLTLANEEAAAEAKKELDKTQEMTVKAGFAPEALKIAQNGTGLTIDISLDSKTLDELPQKIPGLMMMIMMSGMGGGMPAEHPAEHPNQ